MSKDMDLQTMPVSKKKRVIYQIKKIFSDIEYVLEVQRIIKLSAI